MQRGAFLQIHLHTVKTTYQVIIPRIFRVAQLFKSIAQHSYTHAKTFFKKNACCPAQLPISLTISGDIGDEKYPHQGIQYKTFFVASSPETSVHHKSLRVPCSCEQNSTLTPLPAELRAPYNTFSFKLNIPGKNTTLSPHW